jgi:hypothetical protein
MNISYISDDDLTGYMAGLPSVLIERGISWYLNRRINLPIISSASSLLPSSSHRIILIIYHQGRLCLDLSSLNSDMIGGWYFHRGWMIDIWYIWVLIWEMNMMENHLNILNDIEKDSLYILMNIIRI